MRKVVALLLVTVMSIGLTACGGRAETAPENQAAEETQGEAESSGGDKEILALSLQSMDNNLAALLSEAFQAEYGKEYDVQVAGADNDPNTQINQIQNFVQMGAKFILVMPLEAASLSDVLEEAIREGVIVYSAGTPFEPEYVTAQEIIDQFTSGEYCALMVKNWVEETFPEAEDGSIGLAILENTTTPEYVQRINGFKMITEPYLKNADGEYVDKDQNVVDEADRVENPIYCPAVTISVETEARYFQDGQVAMENILLSNPEVKAVIGTDTDAAMGASQAIMDDYAKGGTVENLDEMGCFGVSVFDAEAAAICDSSTGNGVVRGAVAFGSGDIAAACVDNAGKILAGEVSGVIWDPLTMVSAENGERVDVPCAQESGTLIDCK